MSGTYTVEPLSPIRKVIATRLTKVVRTVPHFRLVADIQIDALLKARAEHGNAKGDGVHLSLNDCLIKACADALMDASELNAQWVDGEIRRFKSADIAVVVALKRGGLSTPIIYGAHSKSTWEISREVRELTRQAEGNLLPMHKVSGGTFSISNLGMYGVTQFDAIINVPQCAILAVGAAQRRAIVDSNGDLRTATVITTTLSADHRVVDGTACAKFLRALGSRMATPEAWIVRG